jgi:hypothetical protein
MLVLTKSRRDRDKVASDGSAANKCGIPQNIEFKRNIAELQCHSVGYANNRGGTVRLTTSRNAKAVSIRATLGSRAISWRWMIS